MNAILTNTPFRVKVWANNRYFMSQKEEISRKVKTERTFMMVKPDGVARGLTGEIFKRLEDRGLKIIACKMVHPDAKLAEAHYPTQNTEWVTRLGKKSLKTFEEYKIDPMVGAGSDDPAVVGPQVLKSLMEYIVSGPVIATVVEGIHAIDMVRKVAGHTLPVFADAGTIRGDFSVDSPAVANLESRSIKNIMHASETPEEAANEIALWFKPEEIHPYTRAGEDVMY